MDQSELHPQGDFGATFVDSGGGQPPFSALDLVEATDRAMSIETSAVDDQSYAPFLGTDVHVRHEHNGMEVWHRSRRLPLMWRCRQPRSRNWFCFHRRRSRGWSTLGLARIRISWSRGRTPKILILSTFGAWRFWRPENQLGAFGFSRSRYMLCDYFNAGVTQEARYLSSSEGLLSGKQRSLGNCTRLLRVRKGRSDLEPESLQSQFHVTSLTFERGWEIVVELHW